jgi:hypothetical protein
MIYFAAIVSLGHLPTAFLMPSIISKDARNRLEFMWSTTLSERR